MHLVRNIEDFIEDLEYGRTYEYCTVFSESAVKVNYWGEDHEETIAGDEHAAAFWAYLESLLKFDATKAQDAPQELKVGDSITVAWPGTVREIHEDGDQVSVKLAEIPMPMWMDVEEVSHPAD